MLLHSESAGALSLKSCFLGSEWGNLFALRWFPNVCMLHLRWCAVKGEDKLRFMNL